MMMSESIEPALAGGSIKPGVERSGTPGPTITRHSSPRSGRQPHEVNMSDSYTNLLYHIVFSTKERRPLITPEYEPRLYEYIGGTLRGLKGISLELNGTADHVHLLAKLRPDHALSDVLRKLKANASGW